MPNANANPERRFFIDLITRDISLEDAILDMIDNAVDSLVRTNNINLYSEFINPVEGTRLAPSAEIVITFSTKQFTVKDNCGGISYETALNDIFRFGHPDPHRGASLSVFGIGMKRALFKLGRRIAIESHASDSGFAMALLVNDWLADNNTNWAIPIEEREGEANPSKAGTKINITQLREEVAELIGNPKFQNKLINAIRETYPFYLGRYVRIIVNNIAVEPEDLSIAESEKIKPAIETWEDGKVRATLICGLLPREDARWTTEKSGWYILCNGRTIVYADRTKLTGWGDPLPQFMPKNRGFLGIIFFNSDHPEELPWKTTKRDINTESPVYVRTLKRMIAASRLVTQFQNKMYESNDDDDPKEEYRDSVKDLKGVSATEQAAERGRTEGILTSQRFDFSPSISGTKYSSIQFKVKEEDLIRVKKRLGRLSMPNKEVGEKIFKYYIDRECTE